MKKISKILLGLSTSLATFVPLTLALTSCSDTYLAPTVTCSLKDYNIEIVKNSTDLVLVTFKMSRYLNAGEKVTPEFICEDFPEKDRWFKFVGAEHKSESSNIIFTFQPKQGLGVVPGAIPVKFKFKFEYNGKTRTREIGNLYIVPKSN